jgi:hypothetical protein
VIHESAAASPRGSFAGHQKIAFAVLTTFLLAWWQQPVLVQAALIALLVLPPLLYLIFRFLDGDASLVLLLWVALFPLGYYFLRFPRNHAIILFDPTIIFLLGLAILFCPRNRYTKIPDMLRYSGWVWLLFLVLSSFSLPFNKDSFAARLWSDSLIFPAILGWYVVSCFPVRSWLRALHAIICGVAMYCAGIGLAEIVRREDLLPLSAAGGDYSFAGANGVLIIRPNGPFGHNYSFGLIGLIFFCLLHFVHRAAGKEFPWWQRRLHSLGTIAALLAAMMPLFRSIFISIGIILIWDLFQEISRRQKIIRVAALSAIGIGIISALIFVPEIYQDRVSDPVNFYARVAQQKQNLAVFMKHPFFGVGLANFVPVALSMPGSSLSYRGEAPLDSPHSTLGAVLAETGTFGFVPYVLSQILLVAAFWRFRASENKEIKLVWTFFWYIFSGYWLSGLLNSSGYSSDLNLIYMFALMLIYKYGITAGSGSAWQKGNAGRA